MPLWILLGKQTAHSQPHADESTALDDNKDESRAAGSRRLPPQQTTEAFSINRQPHHVTATKSLSEGHHCSRRSFHPFTATRIFCFGGFVGGRAGERVWLHSKPFKAGFMAHLEIRQALPYESSIFWLETGFNATRSLAEAGSHQRNLKFMASILEANKKSKAWNRTLSTSAASAISPPFVYLCNLCNGLRSVNFARVKKRLFKIKMNIISFILLKTNKRQTYNISSLCYRLKTGFFHLQ